MDARRGIQPDAMQRMVDEWEIRRVVEGYCRLLDDRAFGALVQLFAEDGVFFVMGTRLEGREAIRAFLGEGETSPPERPTSTHLLTNCVIVLAGDEARAESDWTYVRRLDDGSTVIDTAGRYRDRLRRTSDGWRFVERVAIRMGR